MERLKMKNTKLPDYKEKQRLVFMSQVSGETLAEYGDNCFAKGRYDDAVDFYEKASNKTGLKKIADLAVEEGDLFLYKKVFRFLGEEQISPETANRIGARAFDLGKYSFAKKAFEIAGNEDMINKISINTEGENFVKA
ncbi:MAG: hypothetical protein A3C43_09345 [Candidatus Schekmanbacteria bacterium RIFCSPHIGHO2_02_FULL_38_11]|uniref:Uncharacterized protein n=1 Tax=Candidatus Schekmanbacteria bacterium RIFCSPLOWO2_12_FULL_38_15 TaxID=1817883 RepID=A0A1F7SFQ4_9BACT|nr:MAG: hypothetical protein A2043_00715 [Candidatus Schekmanbacteria bacterium GWA2_38_9]OGL49218.1 MAG: hypothetical protein A3C43_09345 [Candidatus Schekmanbacteria bacterium RIFCSPHIGHO2_02_FULL_38_11]OGL52068.1 MAG: hypothetical protein A3G31_06515 [Candidatus Schekmanbacteria bacterium RIFCSPLOWO2_12_FULL_38_15]